MKFLSLLLVVAVVFGVIYFVFFKTTSPFTVNTSSPSVITQLQKLNRFETSSFTIEKIIDAGTNYGALQQFLLGDRLLLIAHGKVIAGFNLSQLQDKDIVVNDKEVTLMLPAPEILITSLDESQTRVYDRQQGFFTHGNKDLESSARSAAEQSIRDAACQGGILDEASKNGREQLTALLKSLGFIKVTITIPSGSC